MRTVGIGAENKLSETEKLEKQNEALKAENKKLKKRIKELEALQSNTDTKE